MVLDIQIDPSHHLVIRACHQHRAIPIAGNLLHPREHSRRVRRIAKLRTQRSRVRGVLGLYRSYLDMSLELRLSCFRTMV